MRRKNSYVQCCLPESILNHTGEKVNHLYHFFAEPPAEIGTILSAESGLKINRTPRSKWGNFRLVVMIFLLCFIAATVSELFRSVIYFNEPFITEAEYPVLQYLSLVISYSKRNYLLLCGIVAPIISWDMIRKNRYFCSYVGDKGIYEHQYGKREGRVFLFDKADTLFNSAIEHNVGTHYNYCWMRDGELQFALSGFFLFNINLSIDFPEAAARSWNRYRYKQISEQLSRGEMCIFETPVYKIEIGRYSLIISRNNRALEWEIADIEKVEVTNRFVYIYNRSHKDMGFFEQMSEKGALSFNYGEIPNADIFLKLMSNLTGKPTEVRS